MAFRQGFMLGAMMPRTGSQESQLMGTPAAAAAS